MKKTLLFMIIILMLMGSVKIKAQNLEITPFVGIQFGGRFSIDTIPSVVVNLKDSMTYGVALGFYIREDAQIEFMWSRQDTKLVSGRLIPGLPSTELLDLYVDQYLFNFIFVAGDEDIPIRPFAFAGLGWTYFNPKANISGRSRIAASLGIGAKLYVNERIGLRLQGKFTPTYISTKNAIFNDPWFGYYVYPYARYIYQFEFSMGLIIRI